MSHYMARRLILIVIPAFLSFSPCDAAADVRACRDPDTPRSRTGLILPRSSAMIRELSDSSRADAVSGRRAVLNYPLLFARDSWQVVTAPARWQRRDWITLSLGVVGVCGVASVDGLMRDVVQRNRSRALDDALEVIEPFGSHYSFYILGVFGAAGMVLGDSKSTAVAMDGLTANVIAGHMITPAFKRAVGRRRPFQTQETYSFHPFGRDDSFPSGHATRAFAVASVVATHYDNWWVRVTAYSVAGLVAAARVDHNVHFLSDVTAGALIGATVGRAVVRFNACRRHGESQERLIPMPFWHDSTAGIGIRLVF